MISEKKTRQNVNTEARRRKISHLVVAVERGLDVVEAVARFGKLDKRRAQVRPLVEQNLLQRGAAVGVVAVQRESGVPVQVVEAVALRTRMDPARQAIPDGVGGRGR